MKSRFVDLVAIAIAISLNRFAPTVNLANRETSLQIFEKSKFASEIGAALIISPNGARVLSRLGFSFSAARAVVIDRWSVLRGDNQELLADVDFSNSQEKFGAGVWAIHRVDLHNELLRLATSDTARGLPVRIYLASEVVDASNEGTVTLQDGTTHTADIVVGADGLHSMLKGVVLGKNVTSPEPTGLSAFRFLIDTARLRVSASLSATLDKKGPGASLLADTREIAKERHIMWYACRKFVTTSFQEVL